MQYFISKLFILCVRQEMKQFYFTFSSSGIKIKIKRELFAFTIRHSSSIRREIFFFFPVAMLRSVSCSASLSCASPFFRFFRQFPRSSTAALRGPARNLRRISSPSAGRRVLLRRGLRVSSAAAGRGVNGQFSRLSVCAVATQPAPSYPSNKRFSLYALLCAKVRIFGWTLLFSLGFRLFLIS